MKQGTSEKRTLRHRLSIEVGIITKKKNPMGHRRDTSREGEREGAGIGKLLGQCMIVRERERERERERNGRNYHFLTNYRNPVCRGEYFVVAR